MILFLYFGIADLFAQNIRSFEHLTDIQGLAQNNINVIFQDKDGFMWFGTDDGLSRYDAYNFKNFYQEQGKNSLKSGSIRALHQSRDGKIWIGTINAGLQFFEPKTSQFFSLDSNDSYQKLKIFNKDIKCITSTKTHLYFGTIGDGLYGYEFSTKTFQAIPFDRNMTKNILTIKSILDSKLIIGTEGNGLFVFDIKSETSLLHFQDSKNGLGNDTVTCITEIKVRGISKYLIGTAGGGISTLSISNKPSLEITKRFGVFEDYVTSIAVRGNKWFVGTSFGEGLLEFNTSDNTVIKHKNNPLFSGSISNDNISQTFVDASSKLWVGTSGTGIDALNPDYAIFTYLNIPYSDVRAIYPITKDKILIATYGNGLILYENRKIIKRYDLNGERSKRLSSLYLQNIYPFKIDKFQEKYLISSWEGLNVLDFKTGNVKQYYPILPNSEGRKPAVTDLIPLNESEYLASTSLDGTGFLKIWNSSTGLFSDFTAKPEINRLILDNQVSFLLKFKNEILIGTRGAGIISYSVQNKTFRIIKRNPSNTLSIGSNDILSGFVDSKNRLWIGTAGGGLNLKQINSENFISFTAKDGILGRNINSITEDKSGDLWLGSNKGVIYFQANIDFEPFFLPQYAGVKRDLLKLNPKTAIVTKTYSTESGISNLNFNQGAICSSKEGKIYIGNAFNILSFYPSTFRMNLFYPKVAITDFQLFNHPVSPFDSSSILSSEINYTKEIDLKYFQNFFGFNFSSLNFINPEKNKFAFRLKNFDKEWIYTDFKRRYASYTGIEPGHYIFELKASNNDGTWSKDSVEIAIHISPPFWQTWWFRILVVLSLGSSTFFIIQYRLKLIEKKAREKAEIDKKLSDAKLIALRAQMNPHFLFNSLNSIQQYIYNNDKEQASNYLSKFAKLIRQILQNSSQNNISLEDEIDMLSLYMELEAMRFQNKFGFEFIIDEDVEPEFMEIPTMLIQPFLENSILHGLATKEGRGMLTISMKDIGGKILEVIIEDDGIGRDKAKLFKKQKLYKYKSMGMEVTNDRLDIINQTQGKNIAVEIIDLRDKNGEGTGTQVKVLIPYEDV